MRVPRYAAALLAVAAALGGASPALAQEEGVTIDPQSPAGTEYAIPTERARQDLSGDETVRKGKQERGSRTAPLFGVGVGPGSGSGGGQDGEQGQAPDDPGGTPDRGGDDDEPGEKATGGSAEGGSADGGAAGAGAGAGGGGTPTSASIRPLLYESGASAGGTGTVVGLAALIVALGALSGFAAHRRRSA